MSEQTLEELIKEEHDFDDRYLLALDLKNLAQLLNDGSIDLVDAVSRLGSLNSKWANQIKPL